MKNVILIYGGEGAERDISLLSAKNVYGALAGAPYNVIPVFISKEGGWYIGSPDPFGKSPTSGATPTYPVRLHKSSGLLVKDGILPIYAALPILHGNFGEDGIIQGALDCAHIPYVGCTVTAGAVSSDKHLTKLIARSLGIPTADWISESGTSYRDAQRARARAERKLGYPMFIKPTSLGSSIGASAVASEDDFDSAYFRAARHGRVLIERLINCDYECECAYLGIGTESLYLAEGRIDTRGKAYGYNEKYVEKNNYATLSPESPTTHRVEAMARLLGEAIGIRGLARLDFFVTESGEIYFNEINTLPGMTEASLYPKLAERLGYSLCELFSALIEEVADDRCP